MKSEWIMYEPKDTREREREREKKKKKTKITLTKNKASSTYVILQSLQCYLYLFSFLLLSVLSSSLCCSGVDMKRLAHFLLDTLKGKTNFLGNRNFPWFSTSTPKLLFLSSFLSYFLSFLCPFFSPSPSLSLIPTQRTLVKKCSSSSYSPLRKVLRSEKNRW